MAEKVYLNAKELKERWGISDALFNEMRKAENLPVETVLHKATLFHICDINAFEAERKRPFPGQTCPKPNPGE